MAKLSGRELHRLGGVMRSARGRSLAFFLLLWAVLALTSGETPGEASRLYLERARSILGSSSPGEAMPQFPAATTWIGVPLAAAQGVLASLGGGGTSRMEFLRRTAPAWTQVLHVLWAAWGALLVLLAARLAARQAKSIAGDEPRPHWVAALGAVLLLVCAPGVAGLVRNLSSGLPAGLLLLVLAGMVTAADPAGDSAEGAAKSSWFRSPIAGGLALGALLAWFPFCWPAAPVVLIALALRGLKPRDLLTVAVPALLLGLALEPSHLLRPLSLITQIRSDWLREGGWSGAGGPGWSPFLVLAAALGPAAWMLWVPATASPRRRDAWALPCLAWGLWLLLCVLPAASGVRRPGAVQGALMAVMAAFAAVPLGSLRRTRAGLTAALLATGLLAASSISGRVTESRRVRDLTQTRAAMVRDLAALVGRDVLWISDQSIGEGAVSAETGVEVPAGSDATGGQTEAATNAESDSNVEAKANARVNPRPDDVAEVLHHCFVLPRDSRMPGRYDFAYWPRWYAGFRWILISSSRVRENLAREQAQVPKMFYRALNAQTTFVREWGDPATEGYRLYRVSEDSTWGHPLQEAELQQLAGSHYQTWFVNALGRLYAQTGDLRTSALLYRQGIDWDPGAVSLYNNLGGIYIRQKEYGDAGKVFEEGLRRAPRAIELLFNYGQLCLQQGVFSRAEELLAAAVAVAPDYAPAHLEIGRAFLAEGKRDLVIRAWTHYLELAPTAKNAAAVRAALVQLETSKNSARPKGEVPPDMETTYPDSETTHP